MKKEKDFSETDFSKKKGRITPRWIDSLKENEIFVFGSNLAGMHGGGAGNLLSAGVLKQFAGKYEIKPK